MNLSFYIARRYLFSRKSHNAINVISAISVCGVALATLALVCTLSVFNGFQQMVAGMFTSFDPDLKITVVKGKVFNGQDARIRKICSMPEVEVCTETLEEQAMVMYDNNQAMVMLKGVGDNFRELTKIDSILYGNGTFMLHDATMNFGILGIDVAARLNCGITAYEPIQIFAPKRGQEVNLADPSTAFNREIIMSPGMVFAVNQRKYDTQYVLTSLAFARKLFGYTKEVSAIELKLKEGVSVSSVQGKIQQLLGPDFQVKDRYEQQADVFRIMKVEKLISYIFLTFILLIACFNVVGSLSMLIIDKKKDVVTLRNLGADNKLITRIFLFEGRMISLAGAVFGIIVGVVLCLLQQKYGFISLGSSGSEGVFVVDAYPVSVQIGDILLILVTVLVVGFLSVWYPVKYLSKKLLKENRE